MSAIEKRRCVEEPEETSSSEAENEDSEPLEDGDTELVQVDFEAFSPTDQDIPGITSFLKQIFVHDSKINLAEIANLIIRQAHQIGSVLKQGEVLGDSDDDNDEPIFGFISVINCTQRKHEPCVQQIQAWMEENCKYSSSNVQQQFLEEIDDDSNTVGLILCERMGNLPSQIVIPLYQSIKKEMAANPSKFNFTHLIRVAKVYKLIGSNPNIGNVEALANEEDKIFQQFSLLHFDYKLYEDTASGDDDEYEQYCRVIVVPADKFDKIIDKMAILFSG